jgi:hypothetical protein
MRVPLKYIREDVDRHGNVRCYVRAPGKRKVRIRALPGTPAFMEEYQAAVATAAAAPLRQVDQAKKVRFVISASATMRARHTGLWMAARAIGNVGRSTRSRASMELSRLR